MREGTDYHTLIVLNDGETYTSADGCKIIIVSDEDMQRLDFEDERVSRLEPLAQRSLAGVTRELINEYRGE